jgi:hypothetical protein
MRTALLLPVFVVCTSVAQAQWDVPTTLQLDGAAPSDRQVTGLAAPQEGADGVSLGVVRERSTNFGVASGANDLSLQLSPAPTGFSIGMLITLVPAAVNTGPITLDVNGLGPVPVVKQVSLPLDSADLRPGIPVTVAWDGSAFQVLNQLHPGCPSGTEAISPDACVELQSRSPVSFYQANVQCAARNGRLCTFAEWIHACQRNAAFLGTVLDYEWVDHAANDADKAKAMGVDGATLLPSCQGGGLRIPTGMYRFRCCYDR